MRKPVLALVVSLLSSVSAFAADIPVIEAPEAPEVDVRRFGWTGATVGVIGGYAWLQDIDRAINFRAAGEDTIYGAYAGYQMQIGQFVGGLEASYQQMNILFVGLPVSVDETFTIVGKFGYALDRVLVYATGGAAYSTTNIGLEDWGYAIGAGVDFAVTDRIIAGARYEYYDYKKFDGTAIDANIDAVTLRLGVKF